MTYFFTFLLMACLARTGSRISLGFSQILLSLSPTFSWSLANFFLPLHLPSAILRFSSARLSLAFAFRRRRWVSFFQFWASAFQYVTSFRRLFSSLAMSLFHFFAFLISLFASASVCFLRFLNCIAADLTSFPMIFLFSFLISSSKWLLIFPFIYRPLSLAFSRTLVLIRSKDANFLSEIGAFCLVNSIAFII